MRDVIIVGGNAIGLYLAKLLEDAGLDVLVLEEHRRIGEPLQCSGLYSKNIERFFRLPERLIQNRILGARLHSKNSGIVLRKKDVAAYVVDRPGMERWLSKRTKSEILTGFRVSRIRVGKKAIAYSGKPYESEIIIGCDGFNSVVARHFGMKPKESILGLIAIKEEENRSNFVDLWFDKDFVRDGFFWKIPRGKTTEYGAFGSGITFKSIERFFGVEKYRRYAGTIPLGGVKNSHFERSLLVGDSAAQVKPWSGGGIVYGLYCSTVASSVVSDAFEKNDFSANALKGYETWRRKIGKNIALGMFWRRLLRRFSNSQLDLVFRLLGAMDLNWLDMDFAFGKIRT
jgi:digeranylgeranylglycerophospholipid reductase